MPVQEKPKPHRVLIDLWVNDWRLWTFFLLLSGCMWTNLWLIVPVIVGMILAGEEETMRPAKQQASNE